MSKDAVVVKEAPANYAITASTKHDVPLGYKKTEVGVIPIDWEAKQIGGDIDLLTGFPFPSIGYTKSGVRLLRGSNVKRGETDWDDDITQHWPRITTDISKYELKDGDLVIAMDGSLVGRSYARLSEHDLPALLLQRVARIRSSKIDTGFLSQFVGSDRFVKYSDSVKTVTAIPHISSEDIRRFTIPVPPTVEEQRAIAAALSDVDALISAQDALIAKKRAIKTAAMQQFLTGKQRLPGFSGEWEVKRLGKIGATYGGLTGKTKADFGVGSARYIPFLNIMNNVTIDPNYLEHVNVDQHEGQNQARIGDLFFNGSSETPEELGMCSVLVDDLENIYLNSFCFGFRFHEGVKDNGLFLSYFFRSGQGRELLYSLAQGATRYNLSKANFLKLEVVLPQTEEQTAIATVLSDMDADIAAFEARCDKTKAIKQGMMQELLTGRTRLV